VRNIKPIKFEGYIIESRLGKGVGPPTSYVKVMLS